MRGRTRAKTAVAEGIEKTAPAARKASPAPPAHPLLHEARDQGGSGIRGEVRRGPEGGGKNDRARPFAA